LKKILSSFLALSMVLSVLVFSPVKASAALNDGDKLSADINLQVGKLNGDVFTPLAAGEALKANDVITVRICPQTDFLVGSSSYVVMFDKLYFSVQGTNKLAFTPNTDNTFYDQTASGYSGSTNIPVTVWPSTFGATENYSIYSVIKVNNQADSTSKNGGYPNLLPGTWLFQFNLKVLKDINAGANARIWMDNRWFRNPSNPAVDGYFAKCKTGDYSSSGQSTTYNFKLDFSGADIKLPLPPAAPVLSASPKTLTNKNVTVTVTYPVGATNKQYEKLTGGWKTYTTPVVLTANDTISARYTSAAGTLSPTGSIVVGNIDKTAPKIVSNYVANSGYTYANVVIAVSDANFSSQKVSKNGVAITWPSTNMFTSDGKYIVTAKDKAGNSSTFTFTIDKTAPAVTAKTVTNNGATRSNVTVTVSDKYLVAKKVTKNGVKITWPSGGVFSAAAKYVITANDKAGNITVFTFSIDRTFPKITVKNLSGKVLANNGSAKGGASFTITEANLYSRAITKNGIALILWPSANKVTAVGTYVITAKDKAGNKTIFTFKVTK